MKTSRDLDGLPQIKVVGVGGAGSNAVSRMAAERIPGVQLVAVKPAHHPVEVIPPADRPTRLYP